MLTGKIQAIAENWQQDTERNYDEQIERGMNIET